MGIEPVPVVESIEAVLDSVLFKSWGQPPYKKNLCETVPLKLGL